MCISKGKENLEVGDCRKLKRDTGWDRVGGAEKDESRLHSKELDMCNYLRFENFVMNTV